jgi:hypothetical protein
MNSFPNSNTQMRFSIIHQLQGMHACFIRHITRIPFALEAKCQKPEFHRLLLRDLKEAIQCCRDRMIQLIKIADSVVCQSAIEPFLLLAPGFWIPYPAAF